MAKKKRKRSRRNYFIHNFIIFLLLCGSLIYYGGTDTFSVNTILIKGNKHYNVGEVIALGEIQSENNIFAFPSKKVKEKLLADPYIKNVTISRRLPNKVVITIEERTEDAQVSYGDKYLVIDKEGLILNVVEKKAETTLIKGMTLTNIKAGTRLDAEEEFLFEGALELLNSMADHDLFFKEIQIEEAEIKAYVYDDLYCQGKPENILKSMDDLKDVLYDLYTKGIERGIIKVGGSGYISYSAVIE